MFEVFEVELLTFVPIAFSYEQDYLENQTPFATLRRYLLDNDDDDDGDGSNRSGVPSLRQNCNQ